MADDETELMELEEEDDDDDLVLLNLSGSRSKFLAPPLLGTKRGLSSTSVSSCLEFDPANLDEKESSSLKLFSTGFLRVGLLILDLSLSLLSCLACFSRSSLSSSPALLVSPPVSGLTRNCGLLMRDLVSCDKIVPTTRNSNIILRIMVNYVCFNLVLLCVKMTWVMEMFLADDTHKVYVLICHFHWLTYGVMFVFYVIMSYLLSH